MVSIALNISDEFKRRINELSWVNWSELAREELILEEKKQLQFRRLKTLVSKSKLSEKDAFELAEKISKGMHDSLKKKGLI